MNSLLFLERNRFIEHIHNERLATSWLAKAVDSLELVDRDRLIIVDIDESLFSFFIENLIRWFPDWLLVAQKRKESLWFCAFHSLHAFLLFRFEDLLFLKLCFFHILIEFTQRINQGYLEFLPFRLRIDQLFSQLIQLTYLKPSSKERY